jgi:hypothetical protein
MTSALIHLVPRLPPAICGLGDYATLVGSQIEGLHDEVRCGYVACAHRVDNQFADGPAQRNVTGSADATRLWQAVQTLIDEFSEGALDRTSLLVHYSGYGYATDGAPRWLADALARRPRRMSAVSIVTMFHELYATGWPWQRAFWYSVQQRRIAIRIARLSDRLVTNRGQSARWLERVTGGTSNSIPSLPVPSNIGEPHDNQPWESRAAQAVAFGGARFKKPFLEGPGATATARLCRKLEIRRLVNIGQRAKVDVAAFRTHGIEIIEAGFLPASDASEQFRTARIALADYYGGYYAKSGVLAAAAAHGTPLIFPHVGLATDGLRFGEQLWDLPSALAASRNDADARLSAMSRSLRAWYDGHNSAGHAALLADAVGAGAGMTATRMTGATKAG